MHYIKGSYDQLGGEPGVDAVLTAEIIYLDIYMYIYISAWEMDLGHILLRILSIQLEIDGCV